MEKFEGYIGIGLGDGQIANDILFLLLLLLLLAFAGIFHSHFSLFMKMVKDIGSLKERSNLFEIVSGNEFLYRNFMVFQYLFLCSIAVFCMARIGGYLHNPDIKTIFLSIGIFFIFLFLYYLFKQGLYHLIGFVFCEPEKFKLWKTNYQAIMGTWGVLLYIPVCGLLFMGANYIPTVTLFIFLYLLCRFVIIYKTTRIFLRKSDGFLYISLYLCTQEILPLLFLYEGVVYLYNFIGASTLWH